MPEFHRKYNFNSLYISLAILIYNVCATNYEYINIIFRTLCLLNYSSILIIINIIGLYLILKYLTFEINIKISF